MRIPSEREKDSGEGERVPQTISVFDVQKLSEEPLPPLSSTNRRSPSGRRAPKPTDTSLAYRKRFQDRRFIVLFFDYAESCEAVSSRSPEGESRPHPRPVITNKRRK